MKNKSKKIIKTLLLSATVALFHGTAKADVKKSFSLDLDLGLPNGGASPEVSKGQQPIVKNVYKIMRNGDAKLIAGHRSHSSHRSSRGGHYSHSSSSSHRSHSSHRSSGGGSHYSHSSSSYGSGSRSSVYTPPAKTAGDYSLGDRTLSTGIHGSDVDQLVPYLVRYYYLKDGVVSKKGGYYVYDSNVVNAVKHFQKDAGMTQDGKLTSEGLTKLKSWSASQTTIPLGFRDLSAAAETSGFDVDELRELLINAGYSPDPAKLKKSGSHYVFTEDVHTALKAFQAYHSIQPNGELNATTLAKLKSYKK